MFSKAMQESEKDYVFINEEVSRCKKLKEEIRKKN